MTPSGDTFRIRLLPLSAIYTLFKLVTYTSTGSFNLAVVACILSPLYPFIPVPAKVDIVPLGDIIRIRLLNFEIVSGSVKYFEIFSNSVILF